MATPSVAQLLIDHPYLSLLPSNRIKCSVTGHELPLNPTAILAHVQGKKFRKSLDWYNFDYSAFLPHIVPHKHDDKKLFCIVTKQELNKIPSEVQKHINGQRFKRAKEELEKVQRAKAAKKTDRSDVAEKEDFWVPPDGSDSEDEKDRLSDLVGSDVEDEEEEEAPAAAPVPVAVKRKAQNSVGVQKDVPAVKKTKANGK